MSAEWKLAKQALSRPLQLEIIELGSYYLPALASVDASGHPRGLTEVMETAMVGTPRSTGSVSLITIPAGGSQGSSVGGSEDESPQKRPRVARPVDKHVKRARPRSGI